MRDPQAHGVAVFGYVQGLSCYTQFSMAVNNDLARHGYEGIALNLDERDRFVNDLDSKTFLMLKNHGTLMMGQNCALAFLRMHFLENAC